jgi:hypothetical protein
MNINPSSRKTLLLLVCAAAGLLVQPMAAQPANPVPTEISARAGQPVVIDTGSCLIAIEPAPGGALDISRVPDGKAYAVYTPPAGTTSGAQRVIVDSGTKFSSDGKTCEPAAATVRHTFNVTVTTTPTVPAGALDESFKVLMAALVLAIVLENAFALLFNWRLFLEFFVGKAWRTPIMFVAALIVVYTFDLDLVSKLFYAYNPATASQAGLKMTWFTRVLTAMVLAGGSAGVNRVMVALGFRSQINPEAQVARLEPTEAFVAVRVVGAGQKLCQVNMDVVDPIPPNTPRVLGFVGGKGSLGARLKELFFTAVSRVPPSGGLKVDTTKAYRVSVSADGKLYDSRGRIIPDPSQAQIVTFTPKAIVDFTIPLDTSKP